MPDTNFAFPVPLTAVQGLPVEAVTFLENRERYLRDFLQGSGLGAWQAYTPTLTASSVNPNLGTGPTQAGRYARNGATVTGHAEIAFGTGASAGTGIYYLSLPVTPAVGAGTISIGGGIWAAAADHPVAFLLTSAAQPYMADASGAIGAGTSLSSLRVHFMYEAA